MWNTVAKKLRMRKTVDTELKMGLLNQVDEFYFSALFDARKLFPISDNKYAAEFALQERLLSSFSKKESFEIEKESVEIKKERVDTELKMGLIIKVDDEFYLLAPMDTDELLPISEEKYAAELALQEALVSSFSNICIPRHKLCVEIKKESVETLTPTRVKEERGESSSSSSAKKLCKICLDMMPMDQMFENKGCLHSFCRVCLSRYIGMKVLEENISTVKCPETDCNGFLQPEHCQDIIPQQVFQRWDTALCESIILDSQKVVYCPFKDCSSLLIDDEGGKVDRSECPSCRRLFCAKCAVAWHDGMICDNFQKLGVDERGKEDLLLMDVANKKQWRRCTNCKFFVEKIAGCKHVKCRCGFEFCYGCGLQWSNYGHACKK